MALVSNGLFKVEEHANRNLRFNSIKTVGPVDLNTSGVEIVFEIESLADHDLHLNSIEVSVKCLLKAFMRDRVVTRMVVNNEHLYQGVYNEQGQGWDLPAYFKGEMTLTVDLGTDVQLGSGWQALMDIVEAKSDERLWVIEVATEQPHTLLPVFKQAEVNVLNGPAVPAKAVPSDKHVKAIRNTSFVALGLALLATLLLIISPGRAIVVGAATAFVPMIGLSIGLPMQNLTRGSNRAVLYIGISFLLTLFLIAFDFLFFTAK
jgi:hypothetical protein